MATKYRIVPYYGITGNYYKVEIAGKFLWWAVWGATRDLHRTVEEAKQAIDQRIINDKAFPMEYP